MNILYFFLNNKNNLSYWNYIYYILIMNREKNFLKIKYLL